MIEFIVLLGKSDARYYMCVSECGSGDNHIIGSSCKVANQQKFKPIMMKVHCCVPCMLNIVCCSSIDPNRLINLSFWSY